MIDFCFKPHPALKEKLYSHNDWGFKKLMITIIFGAMDQILFYLKEIIMICLLSSTLILDSVSFTAEYLYLNKPTVF